jgi:magnesium chelatase family protein
MLVRTFASAVTGIDAVTVTIEVNVSRGVQFFLVGLPDVAVRESHQRIESALRALNLHWPGKQVVINMAPADIRKEGSAYDLPLALGILAADDRSTELFSRLKESFQLLSVPGKKASKELLFL